MDNFFHQTIVQTLNPAMMKIFKDKNMHVQLLII